MTHKTEIETTDTILNIERPFGTPRERVVATWVDLEQIVQWWGPNGFTTVTDEAESRGEP
jgi:uncharacterized protein YndB with AHSA1/START domain